MSSTESNHSTALERYEPGEGARLQTFMPALSVEQAVERRQMLVEYVQKVLQKDVDFGVIPGAGNKPTLLKPGAEKLCTIFGLTKQFEIIERVEDWSGAEHGGEPFFYYLYRCRLLRGDLLIAEADGSCNSRESKYRYRQAQRVCPSCGQAAIIKGKAEYGGGWVCFKKRGGCGAQYPDGAPEIERQEVGRVFNPDIADQVNTIQKMAAKRALVAACLLAVNASEFFTQDVEDGQVIDAQPVNAAPQQHEGQPRRQNGGARPEQHQESSRPQQHGGGGRQRPIVERVRALRDKLRDELNVEERVLNAMLGQYGCTAPEELTDSDAKKYVAELSALINTTIEAQRDEQSDY
jgi:hypothetical protein